MFEEHLKTILRLLQKLG